MKVLHIINSLATGGAEKLIVETLPLFQEQGVQADVLLLNGSEYPLFKELRAKNCCRIYSLGKGSVYNPKHIGKIIPYLKEYDLVHVHLFPAQYFAIAAKRLSFSKKPFVFTEHSTSNRRFQSRRYKMADRIVYNVYTKVICITEKVKAAVVKQTALPAKKLTVIQNGVDLEKIRQAKPLSRQILNFTDRDVLILQVSSFQEPKDQHTVIRSLQHLPANVKLLLAGDGVLRPQCEQLVAELKLQERVMFLGIRSNIPSLLKTADVIVLSSKYEGLSLSSIEGMASGRPFVASNVPGLAEVVGGAGILFPQGDDQRLAQEIRRLMEDESYYRQTAAQCQQRAAQYDIHRMVEQQVALYKSLVKPDSHS